MLHTASQVQVLGITFCVMCHILCEESFLCQVSHSCVRYRILVLGITFWNNVTEFFSWEMSGVFDAWSVNTYFEQLDI